MRRFETALLGLIVAAYLGIAALYAVKTPAWQVPDEPAHYNYVAQLVHSGMIPVLQIGDWNNDYLNAIKAAGFKPSVLDNKLDSVRYEDSQPPLFYILEAPVFALSNGSLIAMRLLSVVFGAGVVIVAYLIIRTGFPAQPYLALATAGFIAFLPQHVAMMAGVDNDSLTELLIALTLLACTHFLTVRTPDQTRARFGLWGLPVLIGVLLGLALITKINAYLLIGVVGVAILLRARRERWSVRHLARITAFVAIPALILGGAWWLHDINVYGFPDFLGLRRHDAVVVGQLRTADYIAVHGLGGTLSDSVQTTFHSFWGQFGWMGVVMPTNVFTALGLFTVMIIIGGLLALIRFRGRVSAQQRDILILLALTGLFALAEIIYYNLTFVQFQGRYLFPGLIPIAFFVAAGLFGWAALIPIRAMRWGIVLVMVAFALFDVYALYRFIIPNLPNWS